MKNRLFLLSTVAGLVLCSAVACSRTDTGAAETTQAPAANATEAPATNTAETPAATAAEAPVGDGFETRVRGAFDNSPFVFVGPAGTYDSVSPDGKPYSTTLNTDFSYVMTTSDGARETGRWSVDGALTCMAPDSGDVHARLSGNRQGTSRCFVNTEDKSVTLCPQPRTDFPPRPINCVVASPPDADGTRTLTMKDGRQATTRKRAEMADMPGDPADRSPLLFESPVGTWETTAPDGSKHIAIHKDDFTTRSESGEVIGHWTVQGGMTCMIGSNDQAHMICFIITEDKSLTCPKLIGGPEDATVNCVVASPLRADGTRTLTRSDGSVSVTRRVN